jgi:uncharacterized protein (TIGR03437 family)
MGPGTGRLAALLLLLFLQLDTDSAAQSPPGTPPASRGIAASPLTPVPPPPPLSSPVRVDDVVNAASRLPEFGRGTLISISGAGFAQAGPGNVQVLLNGRATMIESVGETRIDALIPPDYGPLGQATLVVRSPAGESSPWTLEVTPAAPAIFQYGQGRAMAYSQAGVLNSNERPAENDAVIIVHATGLGPVRQVVVPGMRPVVVPALPVALMIGQAMAQVQSVELDPERLGLYKITAKIGCPGPEARCPQPGVHELRVRTVARGSAPAAITTSTTQAAFAASVSPETCAEATLDSSGNPLLPPDALEIEVMDEDGPPGGLVKDLYPEYDTSNDDWYEDLYKRDVRCPFSIGGTIPPPADMRADGIEGVDDPEALAKMLEQFEKMLGSRPIPAVELPRIVSPTFHYLPPADYCARATAEPGPKPDLPPLSEPNSRRIAPTGFCTQLAGSPFHGKDIVYIHGFSFKVFLQTVGQGAKLPKWPDDPTAFLPGGYWRNKARDYWDPSPQSPDPSHVQRFLRDRHAKNRYILVGWSTGQRLEQAAHAALTQIAEAMVSGTGVGLTDPSDPRGTAGFCARGCILVTHSTGALIGDVAMSRANDPAYQSKYGDIGFIPKMTTTHVALGGAISGSQLATVAMAVARFTSNLDKSLCAVLGAVTQLPSSSFCGFLFRAQDSILEDLVPQVVRAQHNAAINATPVPVLTVAGASHESLWPAKRFFNRAFDDGVVAMDSACGRDIPVGLWPSGILPWGGVLNPRLFDMGMARQEFGRAARFYSEQSLEFLLSTKPFNPRAAAGCTPYKTPWGMLEPGHSRVFNPFLFRPNHYSFIHTTENHGAAKRPLSGLDEMIGREKPPLEDSRSVHGNDIYTRGLVRDGFRASEAEQTRGKVIKFKLFGHKYKWYIWKRTYHQMIDYQSKSAADYVYDYVN